MEPFYSAVARMFDCEMRELVARVAESTSLSVTDLASVPTGNISGEPWTQDRLRDWMQREDLSQTTGDLLHRWELSAACAVVALLFNVNMCLIRDADAAWFCGGGQQFASVNAVTGESVGPCAFGSLSIELQLDWAVCNTTERAEQQDAVGGRADSTAEEGEEGCDGIEGVAE